MMCCGWTSRRRREKRKNRTPKGDGQPMFFAGPMTGTGNTAFDAYRESELQRLEDELKRLEAEKAQFETFLDDLRRARDRAEFDQFLSGRNGPAQDPAQPVQTD